ncbi:GTPase Era [Thiohalocapsa sp. ML1]|uniref:GTPase Era n=1 Tax=Thiohalocapsa sp. ML1 TaxID=1431688 RepID=UPI00073226C3|nr:GTPase Era [Thiohalocapsa sp. ML1]
MTDRTGTIAIVGRPNVGKSTLLNRLLGQKLAITSHKAQTTRHAILGIKSRPDGQLLYVDTPGLHQRGGSALNRVLNRTARSALGDVDLILLVLEAPRFTREDELALDAAVNSGPPVIAAVNKVDLLKDKSVLLPYLAALAQRHAFAEIVPVSAKNGAQVDTLEDLLLARLPEGERMFPDDQLTDRSERFFAAELLREQLTRRYAQELPYAVTVEIERFENQDGRYLIHALIWVERESQKGIIIGRGGEALKATASEARRQMQTMFDCPVHLEVWVKVKESWRSDEAALVSLGYGD